MSLFTAIDSKFQADSNGSIATKQFLLACREILPIFDTLGPVVFAPVKKDIAGNVDRLWDKMMTDTEKYILLFNIVEAEMTDGTHTGTHSCTRGLLWLKRALEFIFIFLDNVLKGEQDLVKCAHAAYDNSLRKYHGWIVRGVFSVAVRAVPYYSDFMKSLKKSEITDEEVLGHMKDSNEALKCTIDEINKYYAAKGLNFEDTV
ncbi:PREDICTED: glycolipid transfer protein-like [Amphimedon queenslandica]|uniref:Glycolipid transfer protein domain-containing protein n=1 Tax=Amphimedon queenslandica TaxID=400682 RepID=A0A1X7U676_AMPQE|nr:PREDICTED: glycolipid transfer protein-like [Amphimedon queenslandica]|eukprot:XP_003388929.1 PREDICTED: glycolipid transfer protein-like [Amphimedon queenslandica]